MSQYRLDFLNDKEFEILSCDLLSLLWSVRIETFKPGRDRGVDGRIYLDNNQEVIIQCKHWEKTGYKKLISHLKADELPKIRRLKPYRYVLVTSVPLSRTNKAAIAELFKPFILKPSDVFGYEDVQSLLTKHPTIVEGHYKLWFSGAEVLRTITSAAIIGRSQYTIDEIKASLPKYVFTAIYTAAIEKLEARKAIVITGAAGIGKTTLARQLLFFYLSHGYQLIHIAKDLSEAETELSRDKKQVFYFDDFLGKNYLEFIEGSQDSRVMDFISRICHTPNKRFILTSRTVILNRAKAISEIFSNANVAQKEFEIAAGNIQRIEKAKILYNHLWQSSLAPDYFSEIFREKRYRKVIDHHNYNPRLVEFVTDVQKVADTPAAGYWDYVTEKFNNPVDVWKGVYNTQLDRDSRWLLCAVVFNGGEFEESALQEAYISTFQGLLHVGLVELKINFEKALCLACGSVLTRTISPESKTSTLSPFNPSVSDFIIRHYASDAVTISDFIVNLQSIDGLNRLPLLAAYQTISKDMLRETVARIVAAVTRGGMPLGFRLRLIGVIIGDQLENSHLDFLVSSLAEIDEYITVAESNRRFPSDIISILFFGCIRGHFEGKEELLRLYVLNLLETPLSRDDLISLSSVVDSLRSYEDKDVIERFRNIAVDVIKDSIDELIEDREVISQYYDYYQDGQEAKREVLEYSKTLLTDFYILFDDRAASQIAESCDIRSIIDRNAEAREEQQQLTPAENREAIVNEDAEIDNLFSGDLVTTRNAQVKVDQAGRLSENLSANQQ